MKIYISLSSPAYQYPSNTDDAQFKLMQPEYNKQIAELHLKEGTEVIVDGHLMYRMFSNKGISLALVKNGRVQYLCLYTIQSPPLFAHSCFVQNLVWQAASGIEPGFARSVLLFFLEKYGIVATSDYHFPGGSRMWIKFVNSCLGKYHVYRNDIQGSLFEIKTPEEFEKHIDQIWGDVEDHFKNIRIYVSKNQLL